MQSRANMPACHRSVRGSRAGVPQRSRKRKLRKPNSRSNAAVKVVGLLAVHHGVRKGMQNEIEGGEVAMVDHGFKVKLQVQGTRATVCQEIIFICAVRGKRTDTMCRQEADKDITSGPPAG